MARLDKRIFGGQPKRRETPCEKWDDRCKQAVALYERGIEYPVIAKRVGCHVSGLYRELKKTRITETAKINEKLNYSG
ncbi:helix-turn-helix domain-containing protein [Bacillus albus]|uniref:helix-turn-helix domain-containing protein n=1 Tax=Bacillus albus TaxID=2026189 RepID=UPI001F5C8EA9|nr:helix-turn-helix domain-containing protein [Bacillus albus]